METGDKENREVKTYQRRKKKENGDKENRVVKTYQRRKKKENVDKENSEANTIPKKKENVDKENSEVNTIPKKKENVVEEKGRDVEGESESVVVSVKRTRKIINYNEDDPEKRRNEQYTKEICVMCHQCQRNDRGDVVRCRNCQTKRYCMPCLRTWYPNVTHDDIAEECPVCRGNCNCKACLRLQVSIEVRQKISNLVLSGDSELEHIKYLVRELLPFLKQLDEEQLMERKIEAKIRGESDAELVVENAKCPLNERMFCDICKTSIFDYHRSCSHCSFDLCLTCCREIRAGQLQAGRENVVVEYINRGQEYLHGLKNKKKKPSIWAPTETTSEPKPCRKAEEDGLISCSCGSYFELKCLFQEKVSELAKRADSVTRKYELEMTKTEVERCECFDSSGDVDLSNSNLLKAASREDFFDNYFYNPVATNLKESDLKHFQWHWMRGEPVVVTDALKTGSGLSWKPLVMWRAFRQIKNQKHDTLLDVKALDCLDWSEGDVNVHQLFDMYKKYTYDKEGWPQILELKDWPPSNMFDVNLPRHGAEYNCCLPFKQYTHPVSGSLNLAIRLPKKSLKPDMWPKT